MYCIWEVISFSFLPPQWWQRSLIIYELYYFRFRSGWISLCYCSTSKSIMCYSDMESNHILAKEQVLLTSNKIQQYRNCWLSYTEKWSNTVYQNRHGSICLDETLHLKTKNEIAYTEFGGRIGLNLILHWQWWCGNYYLLIILTFFFFKIRVTQISCDETFAGSET